jgi:hypothetical protein
MNQIAQYYFLLYIKTNEVIMQIRNIPAKEILKDAIEGWSSLVGSTAPGGIYETYTRSLRWCDPLLGTKECNQEISIETGYFLLSSGTLDVILRSLKTHPNMQNYHRLSHFLNTTFDVWKMLMDLVGMHTFYLRFMLLIKTEVAIYEGYGADNNVTMTNFEFIAAAIGSTLSAILSNPKIRHSLMDKIIQRYSSNVARKIGICLDGLFEASRGFATCRAWIGSIEAVLDISQTTNGLTFSKKGILGRYIPASLWSILTAYSGVKHSPHRAESENQPPSILQMIVDKVNKAFALLVFTYIIFNVIEDEYEPHRWIQNSWLGLLALSVLGASIAKSLAVKHDEQPEDFPYHALTDASKQEIGPPPTTVSLTKGGMTLFAKGETQLASTSHTQVTHHALGYSS